MKGYTKNIEQETQNNTDYRRVLYTGKYSQLVVMSLLPGEEIGEEIHEGDQFFRFEQGNGLVVIDGMNHKVSDGTAVVVPAGAKHNIINDSDKPLKLYTIYSPPQHLDRTVHRTKQDETEEHFDGRTTE